MGCSQFVNDLVSGLVSCNVSELQLGGERSKLVGLTLVSCNGEEVRGNFRRTILVPRNDSKL